MILVVKDRTQKIRIEHYRLERKLMYLNNNRNKIKSCCEKIRIRTSSTIRSKAAKNIIVFIEILEEEKVRAY